MDFAQLLNTVKDNLGLNEEEIIDEEELKREKEQEKYETNLTTSYNINLEKIKYPTKPINILNKQERENINNQYENINPIQNIYNKNGELTHIKELNVSTITMFFPLDCDIINLSMISKYICPICNIIGCKKDRKLCRPINENDIKKTGRGKKRANNAKEDKFICAVKIPGTSTHIPLKKLKQFDNQYSYYVHFENHNEVIPYFDKLKTQKYRDKILKPRIIKIFQNGGLTILGLKTLEHGFAIAQKVVDELNTIMIKEPLLTTRNNKKNTEEEEIAEGSIVPIPIPIKFFRDKAGSISYDTHLINATYYIDFKINRSELHKSLVNKYGITKNQCDYRPNAYPAVPIKFYWNEDNRFNGKFGKCTCTRSCNGKGIGRGNGQCKAITITVFESGSISFMGAKHKEQLSDCYHFINSILNMEYENVFKEKCKVIKPKLSKKKYLKRIRININQVSNFEIRAKLLAI
jgi:TATA-box binding protein (TBP) (component of TFIID and TFIIIB)